MVRITNDLLKAARGFEPLSMCQQLRPALINLKRIRANFAGMAQCFPEKLGSALLARNGSRLSGKLRIAAAGAYRHGRLDTAGTLVRMADDRRA